MRKIIYTVAAAAAVLAGTVAAAAPAIASNGPAALKVTVHASQHLDTTSPCPNGIIQADCVWAYDNLSEQWVVTPAGQGQWDVSITDHGSFQGFADPVTGAALDSTGPVLGTYDVTVYSDNTPLASNLPPQMNGPVSTTEMIRTLFADPSANVVGGNYTFSYQNGNYVQDTNGITGQIRGH
jgi:hypothetical protein